MVKKYLTSNSIILLQICFPFFFVWFSNLILYFTNFNKNINIFCIRINPMKLASKTFFYLYLSFVFLILISVNKSFSSISATNSWSEKYMSVFTLSFSKALCCSFIFSAKNAFNDGIITDCFFFLVLNWCDWILDQI